MTTGCFEEKKDEEEWYNLSKKFLSWGQIFFWLNSSYLRNKVLQSPQDRIVIYLRKKKTNFKIPAACNGVHKSRSFALTSPPYSINKFKIWSLLSIEHWWIGVRPSSFAVFGLYCFDWRRLRTSSTSCRAVARI